MVSTCYRSEAVPTLFHYPSTHPSPQLTEEKSEAQRGQANEPGYTAKKWQERDLNPGLILKPLHVDPCGRSEPSRSLCREQSFGDMKPVVPSP